MPDFKLTPDQSKLLAASLRDFAHASKPFDNEMRIAYGFDIARRYHFDCETWQPQILTLAEKVEHSGQVFSLTADEAGIAHAAMWHAIGNQHGINRPGDPRAHNKLDIEDPTTSLFITMAYQSRAIERFANELMFQGHGLHLLTNAVSEKIDNANNPLFKEYDRLVTSGELTLKRLQAMIDGGLRIGPFDMEQHEWTSPTSRWEFTRYQFHTSLLGQAINRGNTNEIALLLRAGADPFDALHDVINDEGPMNASPFSMALRKPDVAVLITFLEHSTPQAIESMRVLYQHCFQGRPDCPEHLAAYINEDIPKTITRAHHQAFSALAAKQAIQSVLNSARPAPDRA